MRVLTRQQMLDVERQATRAAGMTSSVLMERAGREVATLVEGRAAGRVRQRVTVVCGRGQNGGDGFVAARVLARAGADVDVVLLGRGSDAAGDARTMFDALRGTTVRVFECPDARTLDAALAGLRGSDVIVDALVGTGLRGALDGPAATAVAAMNDAGVTVVSVDLPSGLVADRADVPGPAVRADLTVTFAAPKPALVLPPAMDLAGRLVVADIGIPADMIEAAAGPRLDVLTAESTAALVPGRRAASHKGDYGHVLVVAGSPGMTGAAALAGLAALRSGAGLVTVATPRSCLPVVAGYRPELMTLGLPETSTGGLAVGAAADVLARRVDVIAIGPGLGRDPETLACVEAVCRAAVVPLVIDADALAAFSGRVEALRQPDAGRVRVITPHEGELARLLGTSVDNIRSDRLAVVRDVAGRTGAHVVLKGHRTLVASPSGGVAINPTGNPGMATAGAGDVLTGAIAGWLGQIGVAQAAVCVAVHLHGLAGDLAAESRGYPGLVAGDIADALGAAAKAVSR